MPRYRAVRVSVDHPLARPNASLSVDGTTVQIWEHRVVLFDQIGYGPHRCHWCGKCINWERGLSPTSLTVDHLDENVRNNDPSNLVASCHSCNSHRHERVADDEVFIVKQGKRLRAVELTCQRCAKPFLIERGAAAKRRFCSRTCLGF